LPSLHGRLADVAQRLKEKRGLHCEVVYVDDGSRDATFAVAQGLSADGLDLQLVSLSRNFGKEAAIHAGMQHARRAALLFIDGDGQHPPDLIETLVAHWLDDGYDVVYTAKASRESEPLTRRLAVKVFYAMINWRARQPIPEDAGDFRLLSPRAAEALKQMPERHRFFKGLASWIGFRQIRVDYEPVRREHGRSSWNLWGLIGLSIEGLTSFSVAPLRVASLFGAVIAATAFFFGTWILVETVLLGFWVGGFPSVMVSMMVVGGVQLIMIGVAGEYVGKILSEIKGRPVYFVAEHSVKSADGARGGETRQTAAE
jgi:glycosyltransferase involved in cell wall biosynthesis